MKEYLNDVGQLRMLWEMIRNDMSEKEGFDKISDHLLSSALGWIAEKQSEYTGDIYLEKIENNAVYLSEASFACLDVATEFLCQGKPIIDQQEIQPFVWSIRQNAFEPARMHQEYILHGCNGCMVHNQHNYYSKLRESRISGSPKNYIEEIEFWCIWYQMKFLILQNFLSAFLGNHDFAGIARQLSPTDVRGTLDERANMTLQLFGKLMNFNQGAQRSQSKKTWREIWKKEFKAISKKQVNRKKIFGMNTWQVVILGVMILIFLSILIIFAIMFLNT